MLRSTSAILVYLDAPNCPPNLGTAHPSWSWCGEQGANPQPEPHDSQPELQPKRDQIRPKRTAQKGPNLGLTWPKSVQGHTLRHAVPVGPCGYCRCRGLVPFSVISGQRCRTVLGPLWPTLVSFPSLVRRPRTAHGRKSQAQSLEGGCEVGQLPIQVWLCSRHSTFLPLPPPVCLTRLWFCCCFLLFANCVSLAFQAHVFSSFGNGSLSATAVP